MDGDGEGLKWLGARAHLAAQAPANQQGYLTAAQTQRHPPERGKSMGLWMRSLDTMYSEIAKAEL